jgi:hypothetical protein
MGINPEWNEASVSRSFNRHAIILESQEVGHRARIGRPTVGIEGVQICAGFDVES